MGPERTSTLCEIVSVIKKCIFIFLLVALACTLILGKLQRDVDTFSVTKHELLNELSSRESIPENYSLEWVDWIESDDSALVCAIANSKNGLSPLYYALEFAKIDEKYIYVRSYDLQKQREDSFYLHWENGFVFLSNNPDNKFLQIDFFNFSNKIESLSIEIKENPCIYYIDLYDFAAKYHLNPNNPGVVFKYSFQK